MRCPYAHSCTFFVVHYYVSCFDYGYDYYSPGYGGIFWPLFSVISDSGSFPDRVSSKLGSARHGSTTTLDYLDQAVADFEQGLDSILTDSLVTLELDTSLEEPDAITSSVSSGFLHLVTFLATLLPLESRPLLHEITSL